MNERVHQQLISEAVSEFGLVPAIWTTNQGRERLVKAGFGRWRALMDTEEGLVQGEEGELHALVIGSKRSRRVGFQFTADDTDVVAVKPFEDVEPV
jgi:hypothetical protein